MPKNRRLTRKDLIKKSTPVWKKLGINPSYGKKIEVYTGTTKQLQKVGIPKGYSGYSYPKQKGVPKPEVFINIEEEPETIIKTLGHETAHIILKNATKTKVGIRKAEKLANATERVFFAEVVGIKKKPADIKIVCENLNPQYKFKN